MLVITLTNGDQYQYDHPVSPWNLIKSINPNLSQYCVAAQINGKLIDIFDLISHNVKLKFITADEDIGLNIIRNSCAYFLGYAIKQLWPKAKLVNESVKETEFYYDIDLNINLTKKDLEKLTQKMQELINKKVNITAQIMSLKDAKKIFQNRNEVYKLFILNNTFIDTQYITLYLHEKYVDIGHGPYVPDMNFCRYFKLHKISKVYWISMNINATLQRIHGVAWFHKTNSDISACHHQSYNNKLKKQDHRDLSYQLDLYHIQKDAPGMIFWHNNGWVIFQELKNFIRKKLKKYQYQEVKSPVMIDHVLWKKTGHWDNYYENIFSTASENRIYCIKPMNCPGHIQIFNQGIKSYKDLPIRMAEFGNCHRNEPSGSLHGLMRIREFTQDDAHIFCTPEQIQNELNQCIKMMYTIYSIFGFKKITVKLSTRPKKRIGQDILWDTAEQHLSNILKKNNISFQYQPYDGAFYGPKIEFILLDSLERPWQCGTIQLDFSSPQLLGARYVDNNNTYKVPVMIHRAILGSIERFIGLLTEEYLGFFPTWLAPVQVVLISITSEQSQYVVKIAQKLKDANIRVKTDLSNEKIGFKIRLYTIHRVPYIIICGKSEMNRDTISIRTFKGKEIKNYKIDIFLSKLHNEICTYSYNQLED